MTAPWPTGIFNNQFEKEERKFQIFQDVVTGVRDLRTRLGMKPNQTLEEIRIGTKSLEAGYAVKEFESEILHLVKVKVIAVQDEIKRQNGMIGRVYSQLE